MSYKDSFYFPQIKISRNIMTTGGYWDGNKYYIVNFYDSKSIIHFIPENNYKYSIHFVGSLKFMNFLCTIQPNNLDNLLPELEKFLINIKNRIEKLIPLI